MSLPCDKRDKASVERRRVHVADLVCQPKIRLSLPLKESLTSGEKRYLHFTIEIRLCQLHVTKTESIDQKTSLLASRN